MNETIKGFEMRTKDGWVKYFNQKDITQTDLLEMQEKHGYHSVKEIDLLRCDCGRLYPDSLGLECVRCEKLRDDCDREQEEEFEEE